MHMRAALICALALATVCGAAPAADDDASRREAMVAQIERLFSRDGAATGLERLDPVVGGALAEVPRHRFVPEGVRDEAYANRPLPIGYGQTISQPYIVALMTQLLGLEKTDRVLELGTGSGYQAAVAAELAAHVYSIEIVPELADRASNALREAGYQDVTVRNADGYHGWPKHAPFDAIIVTAATDHVPPPLVEQLEPGGRLILPLGDPFSSQVLTVVEKSADGEMSSRQILPVRFVPLTRGEPN